MNREDAITNLNMIRVAFVEPVTPEQAKLIDETFELAIEALEEKQNIHDKCKRCVEFSEFEQKPCEDGKELLK